jgi:hypothetical protein
LAITTADVHHAPNALLKQPREDKLGNLVCFNGIVPAAQRLAVNHPQVLLHEANPM